MGELGRIQDYSGKVQPIDLSHITDGIWGQVTEKEMNKMVELASNIGGFVIQTPPGIIGSIREPEEKGLVNKSNDQRDSRITNLDYDPEARNDRLKKVKSFTEKDQYSESRQYEGRSDGLEREMIVVKKDSFEIAQTFKEGALPEGIKTVVREYPMDPNAGWERATLYMDPTKNSEGTETETWNIIDFDPATYKRSTHLEKKFQNNPEQMSKEDIVQDPDGTTVKRTYKDGSVTTIYQPLNGPAQIW